MGQEYLQNNGLQNATIKIIAINSSHHRSGKNAGRLSETNFSGSRKSLFDCIAQIANTRMNADDSQYENVKNRQFDEKIFFAVYSLYDSSDQLRICNKNSSRCRNS